MARCVYCDAPLGGPQSDSKRRNASAGSHRDAYDPHLGRLWRVCGRCARWNPVPLELRWEALEALEYRVRAEGRIVLSAEHLVLFRLGPDEVVRVREPSLTEWGAWRYGTRLMRPSLRRGFLARALESLPPAPLEGYDPYGLSGLVGGVGGKLGPTEWLASPFLEHARPLSLAFAAVPFAEECPSCDAPMLLQPWDLAHVRFHVTSHRIGVEADCGRCELRVPLDLRSVRPALRMGLAILDSDRQARVVGDRAGAELDRVGGARSYLRGLGELGAFLGELDRLGRVGLGISLDLEAEAEALEQEWSKAEEIASIMDGELTEVPGFREFRERVLNRLGESV